MVRPALFVGLLLNCSAALAQDAVAPDQLNSYSTPYSVGFEWHLTGDANNDAVTNVQFRRPGTTQWHSALDLMRIDYQGRFNSSTGSDQNMLSGSILFLMPDQAYEVQLTLTDPDGGSTTRNELVQTRALPKMPVGGRTFHVAPGSGGGTGTQADPFRGVAAANAVAQAGDTFLLNAGNYGAASINRSGSSNNRIVWKAAGNGQAVLDSLSLDAAHVWVDGLNFQYNQNNELKDSADRTYGLLNSSGRHNNVLTGNNFNGYNYSVRLHASSDNWHITDNVIVGDKTQVYPPGEAPGQLSGEGIELGRSSGHVVAYNRISRTSDGISYPERNVDIFGNHIFEVSDDGVETDYGYANNRVWGNRLHDVSNYVFSFQPMHGGPWYFIRNEATGMGIPYKFAGTVDRFVSAHNTFVDDGTVGITMQNMLHALSRNNLYISTDGNGPNWRTGRWNAEHETVFPPYLPLPRTDVDHDGFDWGDSGTAIRWNDVDYTSLEDFANAIGIEQNAIRVDKNEIFVDFTNDGTGYNTLRAGANAIDAGGILANINDRHAGDAPDLGAYEHGQPLPHYGPRDEQQLKELKYDWSNWHGDPLTGRRTWDLDIVASNGTTTGGFALPSPFAAFTAGAATPDLDRHVDDDEADTTLNAEIASLLDVDSDGEHNLYTLQIPHFLNGLPISELLLEIAYVSTTNTDPDAPLVTLFGFNDDQGQLGQLLDESQIVNFSGGLWGGIRVYDMVVGNNAEWHQIQILTEADVFIDKITVDTTSLVPEPTSLGLLGLGSLALLGRRRRTRASA